MGYQSIISNSRHSIVGDEPSQQGHRPGVSPEDLLLSALASCQGSDRAFYRPQKGLDGTGRRRKVEMYVKRNPDRSLSTTVTVQMEIEGDLSAEHGPNYCEADNCYVHRMIKANGQLKMRYLSEKQ
ncbi:MAG: OsmC family protein [Haliscomenobacter sp.]|nr:OsmC family protein [Haliscomenobacter sp.]MBK9488626.1 OsmC family protein [Haliscomenobacter sp.]